jgi:hypothetical protein
LRPAIIVPMQSMKPSCATFTASSGSRFGDRSATNWPSALVNGMTISFPSTRRNPWRPATLSDL